MRNRRCGQENAGHATPQKHRLILGKIWRYVVSSRMGQPPCVLFTWLRTEQIHILFAFKPDSSANRPCTFTAFSLLLLSASLLKGNMCLRPYIKKNSAPTSNWRKNSKDIYHARARIWMQAIKNELKKWSPELHLRLIGERTLRASNSAIVFLWKKGQRLVNRLRGKKKEWSARRQS